MDEPALIVVTLDARRVEDLLYALRRPSSSLSNCSSPLGG